MGEDPVCLEAPVLVAGEPVSGRLTRGDQRFLGRFIDHFAVDFTDSTTVEASLTSSQFDPFLYQLAPGQRVLAQAFDSAGAPTGEPESAVLRIRIGPGCHLLGVSSWEQGATGSYILSLDLVHLPDADASH